MGNESHIWSGSDDELIDPTEWRDRRITELEALIKSTLEIAEYGSFDGAHHKMWVIDQMVRCLTGDKYETWIKEFKAGEDGPDTYCWDEGVAP